MTTTNKMAQPAVTIDCERCHKEFSSVTAYEYDWNTKKKIQVPLEMSKSNWTGSRKIQLTDNRHTNYFAIVHKKKEQLFMVNHRFKFDGMLVHGYSNIQIHFENLLCEECLHKTIKRKTSFHHKFDALVKKAQEGNWSWDSEIDVMYDKGGSVFNNFGCVMFGFTTIEGWTLEGLEEKVAHEMKETFKTNFEFVYTYSERLNPDRDGVYCIVRPLSFIKYNGVVQKRI